MDVVTDQDIKFAQALAALCREHGMTSFQLEYRPDFNLGSHIGSHETRRVTWTSGRHGAQSNIRFRLEAEATFAEQVTP